VTFGEKVNRRFQCSRRARIDAAGAVHHVIGRENNRQTIFSDKKDHLNFIERLGDLVVETERPCFAWALIPNHFTYWPLMTETGMSSQIQCYWWLEELGKPDQED
jgi:hypothetical protein